MSTRAVTDFVAGQLNGQVFGNFPAVSAVAEFPAVSQAGTTPQCWVWPERGEEKRLAAPRFAGVKTVEHEIVIWCLLMMKADSAHSFRDLIEGIIAFWRTYRPMPVRGVVDAVTGQSSDILSIGETVRYSYDVPVATKSQRLQAYSATITLVVTEAFGG